MSIGLLEVDYPVVVEETAVEAVLGDDVQVGEVKLEDFDLHVVGHNVAAVLDKFALLGHGDRAWVQFVTTQVLAHVILIQQQVDFTSPLPHVQGVAILAETDQQLIVDWHGGSDIES